MYRINERVRAVKGWRQATVLEYASFSRPRKTLGWGRRIRAGLRNRMHWADQSTEKKCRLGLAIGLMSSSLLGPSHILRRTSKFTRKLVDIRLGGEVYAHSETVDHLLSSKD